MNPKYVMCRLRSVWWIETILASFDGFGKTTTTKFAYFPMQMVYGLRHSKTKFQLDQIFAKIHSTF